MDNRAEVREFLTTRRAKLSPADAGLPDIGQRRVPGLRRGEVATLAGVSERYVQTQFEFAFYAGGATGLSYGPIVGSSEKGAVLH